MEDHPLRKRLLWENIRSLLRMEAGARSGIISGWYGGDFRVWEAENIRDASRSGNSGASECFAARSICGFTRTMNTGDAAGITAPDFSGRTLLCREGFTFVPIAASPTAGAGLQWIICIRLQKCQKILPYRRNCAEGGFQISMARRIWCPHATDATRKRLHRWVCGSERGGSGGTSGSGFFAGSSGAPWFLASVICVTGISSVRVSVKRHVNAAGIIPPVCHVPAGNLCRACHISGLPPGAPQRWRRFRVR